MSSSRSHSAAWRFGLNALSLLPGLPAASVLIFHRVLSDADPLRPTEPTVAEFAERMAWLRSCFEVVSLDRLVDGLRAGRLPRRALAITFDDGYADNHEHAAAVLEDLGLPATFFVAAGYLDGGRMFNDTVIETVRHLFALDLSDLGLGRYSLESVEAKRAAIAAILKQVKYKLPAEREQVVARIAERATGPLPANLMMQSHHVADLRARGFEIGGHTVGHPILAQVDPETARREIVQGRLALERICGAPVRFFAYPNGRPMEDYRREHVDIVRAAGFEAAVSTAWGAARPGADLYQIPRFTPWDRSNRAFCLRLARNYFERVNLATASAPARAGLHGSSASAV